MSDTPTNENITYPNSETAKAMPSKEAAVGAELMFIHNVLVANINNLTDEHNAVVNSGGTTETAEGQQRFGAINSFNFVLKFLEQRIREYVEDLESVVGMAEESENAGE